MKFVREKFAEKTVGIPVGDILLKGDVALPKDAEGLVIFAHGSGSSRLSPRNKAVAQVILEAGVGTLLFDLLTRAEELSEDENGHLRFDIPFLAGRLNEVKNWVERQPELKSLRTGYFGSSTGAGAALVAAANEPNRVGAVVSRGGRPDLAGPALPAVEAPTLLIAGSRDHQVLKLNEEAYDQLICEKELKVIPGATHLFEEQGALDQVALLAASWFAKHLKRLRR